MVKKASRAKKATRKAVRASKAKRGAPVRAAKARAASAKYEQSGAPWWKQFLPR